MIKNTWRKVRRAQWLRDAGCWIIAQYIRLVWATGRWEVRNRAIPEAYWAKRQPFIMSFWHGRMLVLPALWPKSAKIHMLISMHRDGELIANAIAQFGHGTVRGSAGKPGSDKDKGGLPALRAMLKALKAGEYVGITPDGPRGPRMRASDGIVTVAKVSGVPIIPCAYGAKRRWVLGSWDRFIIPLPFTRGVIVWGEPVTVARDAGPAALEIARLKVEAALNAVADAADEAMGVEKVEPAPATRAATVEAAAT
jgi:lysophospholipid acyltransferase (LPLAT)-like uncharacterized protein